MASNVYGIKKYDISTGEVLEEYPVEDRTYCVSFQCSRTGTYLIAAFASGSLVAYNTRRPENLLLCDSGHSRIIE